MHTKKVFNEVNPNVKYDVFGQFCGKILCTMFKTKPKHSPLDFNN